MLQIRPAFLDVADSLTGRRWVGPTLEESRLADAMAREAGLDGVEALEPGRRVWVEGSFYLDVDLVGLDEHVPIPMRGRYRLAAVRRYRPRLPDPPLTEPLDRVPAPEDVDPDFSIPLKLANAQTGPGIQLSLAEGIADKFNTPNEHLVHCMEGAHKVLDTCIPTGEIVYHPGLVRLRL